MDQETASAEPRGPEEPRLEGEGERRGPYARRRMIRRRLKFAALAAGLVVGLAVGLRVSRRSVTNRIAVGRLEPTFSLFSNNEIEFKPRLVVAPNLGGRRRAPLRWRER